MQTVIVIDVITFVSTRALAAGLLLAAPFALGACGTSDEPAPASTAAQAGDCPTEPVEVVVSVDQWGKIVSALAGACANVTTVLSGSSVDPHDFEPTPSDAAAFEGAQLVVINGGHYDEWAAKLAESTAPDAPVVDAMTILAGDHEGHDHEGHEEPGHEEPGHEEPGDEGHGHGDGANPHAWYSPVAVTDVAEAVTAKLTELAPAAGEYFGARNAEFTAALQPYRDLIAEIKAGATGKSYAATESLFDDMAAELGLANRTPPGYQVAASNESDPSPADLDAFLRLLSDRGVDVLIYNTQTEGSVPQQLRAAAESAGVPVVDVTETVAPGAPTFEAWQVDQLTALAEALGVR